MLHATEWAEGTAYDLRMRLLESGKEGGRE